MICVNFQVQVYVRSIMAPFWVNVGSIFELWELHGKVFGHRMVPGAQFAAHRVPFWDPLLHILGPKLPGTATHK